MVEEIIKYKNCSSFFVCFSLQKMLVSICNSYKKVVKNLGVSGSAYEEQTQHLLSMRVDPSYAKRLKCVSLSSKCMYF